MKHDSLDIKAALQVLRPPQEVFDAIVDPAKMSNYFISQSSGKMEAGKNLVWLFPEFKTEVPVRVGEIRPYSFISYYWDGPEGREHLVEISLRAHGDEATVVSVTEKGGRNDDAGIKWLKGNTEGWANFLACLKAYVEYGINLRRGAFDFRSDKG